MTLSGKFNYDDEDLANNIRSRLPDNLEGRSLRKIKLYKYNINTRLYRFPFATIPIVRLLFRLQCICHSYFTHFTSFNFERLISTFNEAKQIFANSCNNASCKLNEASFSTHLPVHTAHSYNLSSKHSLSRNSRQAAGLISELISLALASSTSKVASCSR